MSPEAVALFNSVEDESVLQAIDNQILLLQEANKSEFGYTGLVKIIKEINLKDASGYQGLLQVFRERGFINAANVHKYMMNGRKDACGMLIPEISLKLLMMNSEDFEEEE
jgi:hypothetical protein